MSEPTPEPTPTEPDPNALYTLEEARQMLCQLQCDQTGHTYTIVNDVTGPVRVVCETCGKSWDVVREQM